MSRVRVHAFSVSLDGYGAGPDQDLDQPLGAGGMRLHDWVFTTRTGRAMIGEDGGDPGMDDDLVAAGFAGIGATVMGRNMFVDELHVAIVPVLLGGSERLFDDLDGGPVGYERAELVGTAHAAHVRLVRTED